MDMFAVYTRDDAATTVNRGYAGEWRIGEGVDQSQLKYVAVVSKNDADLHEVVLVGKVTHIEKLPMAPGEKQRYRLHFDEYCKPKGIRMAWTSRWPSRYCSLSGLGIDPSKVTWFKRGQGAVKTTTPQLLNSTGRPDISVELASIAQKYATTPEKVKISIELT